MSCHHADNLHPLKSSQSRSNEAAEFHDAEMKFRKELQKYTILLRAVERLRVRLLRFTHHYVKAKSEHRKWRFVSAFGWAIPPTIFNDRIDHGSRYKNIVRASNDVAHAIHTLCKVHSLNWDAETNRENLISNPRASISQPRVSDTSDHETPSRRFDCIQNDIADRLSGELSHIQICLSPSQSAQQSENIHPDEVRTSETAAVITKRCNDALDLEYFKIHRKQISGPINEDETTEHRILSSYSAWIGLHRSQIEKASTDRGSREHMAIRTELQELWSMKHRILLIVLTLGGVYLSIVLTWIAYFWQFGIDIIPYLVRDPINQSAILSAMIILLGGLGIVSYLRAALASATRKFRIWCMFKNPEYELRNWYDPLGRQLQIIRDICQAMEHSKHNKLRHIVRKSERSVQGSDSRDLLMAEELLRGKKVPLLYSCNQPVGTFIKWSTVAPVALIFVLAIIVGALCLTSYVANPNNRDWIVTSSSLGDATHLSVIGYWGENVFVTRNRLYISNRWDFWKIRRPNLAVSTISEDAIVCMSDTESGVDLCRQAADGDRDDSPDNVPHRRRSEYLLYRQIEREMGGGCSAIEVSDAFRFDRDQAVLSDQEIQRLKGFLEGLDRVDVQYIKVFGFSSPDGPEGHNRNLSQLRAIGVADFVEQYFVRYEVDVRPECFGEMHLTQGIANSRSVRIGVCRSSDGS